MKLLSLAAAGVAAVTAVQASEGCKLTGFYAGLNMGAVRTSGKANFEGRDGSTELSGKSSGALKTSLSYGLLLGYNYGINENVVIGVELYAQFANKKVESKTISAPSTWSPTREFTTKLTQQPSYGVALRAGYVVGKNTLVYLRVGAEHAKFTYAATARNISDKAKIDNASVTKSVSGIRANIGAGVEYYITPSMFAGGEYRYGFKKSLKAKSEDQVTKIDANTSQHFFLAKVGYKF